MASAFEIGTMFGGIFLGFISDRCYSKRSPIGCVAIIISFLICFTLTFNYKTIQSEQLAVSLFFLGLLLGGMHHILCVTCAADLGQKQALKENKEATSTVTGIIDGLGSLGTAVGQFIIGHTVTEFGWKNGYLLIISFVILCTIWPMGIMLKKEIKQIIQIRQAR